MTFRSGLKALIVAALAIALAATFVRYRTAIDRLEHACANVDRLSAIAAKAEPKIADEDGLQCPRDESGQVLLDIEYWGVPGKSLKSK